MTEPHAERLVLLRDALISGSGGVFRNTVHESLVTCSVCATPVDGYARCFPCAQQYTSHGNQLADVVGIVTYAIAGEQSGYVMRGYKARPPVAEHRVTVLMLSALALQLHADCAPTLMDTPLTHWATVPSLPQSSASHPLRTIVSPFVIGDETPLIAADSVANPRDVDGSHFKIDSVELTAGAHVLLVDDTWTTGGHAQSAVLALRAAGARHVSVLVLARWLSPSFRGNADFIRHRLTADFDPTICPWTGAACP